MHRSKQGAIYGKIGSNYVASVEDLIADIKRDGRSYCDNPEDFKKDLDAVSKKIFGYVKDFVWTITADGKDYNGKIGCCNCDSFASKRLKQLGVKKQEMLCLLSKKLQVNL